MEPAVVEESAMEPDPVIMEDKHERYQNPLNIDLNLKADLDGLKKDVEKMYEDFLHEYYQENPDIMPD